MKSFFTALLVLSASAVLAMPADKTAAAAGVNEAANNGQKGIDAANDAALAEALAEAGDCKPSRVPRSRTREGC